MILQSKMTTTYSTSSPYYITTISNNILDMWVPRNVPASNSDSLITISNAYEFRPDLLAYDLYGSASLWWVFAQRNPSKLASDPLGNFRTGTLIYIPNATSLKNSLGL
jgi:hypothetical protein